MSRFARTPLTPLLLFVVAELASQGSDDARRHERRQESGGHPPPNPRLIRVLIQQLGDDSVGKRDEASKHLAASGTAAWEPLREAARTSVDAEVRRRATRAAAPVIEQQLFREQRRFERHVPKGWTWATRSRGHARWPTCHLVGLRRPSLLGPCQRQAGAFFGEAPGAYWCLALSADGKRLIAGGNDRIARVFDVLTGKQLTQLVGHGGAVWGAVLSPDGKQAITGGWDKSLRRLGRGHRQAARGVRWGARGRALSGAVVGRSAAGGGTFCQGGRTGNRQALGRDQTPGAVAPFAVTRWRSRASPFHRTTSSC